MIETQPICTENTAIGMEGNTTTEPLKSSLFDARVTDPCGIAVYNPQEYLRAVVPHTTHIETILQFISKGTRSSEQWQKERIEDTTMTDAIEVYMHRAAGRDARVIFHLNSLDAIDMLRAASILRSA